MNTNNNTQKMFNADGHLNLEGQSVCAEALREGRWGTLPAPVLQHVEDCDPCKQDILEIKRIVDELPEEILDDPEEIPHGNSEKQVITRFPYYRTGWFRMAAAILIMAGIGTLVVMLWQRSKPGTEELMGHQQSPATPSVIQQDTIKKISPEVKQPQKQEKEILAQVFVPNQELENLLVGQTRSSDFELKHPGKQTHALPSTLLEFQYQSKFKLLKLKIMDNTGAVVEKVNLPENTYQWKSPTKPGLYYWLISSESDILAGGKVVVK